MLFSDIEKLSSRDLCFQIGNTIQEDIKNKKLKKGDVAKNAGITSMSLYRLCNGENASVETLLKVLKTIGKFDAIDALVTASPPEPMSFYKNFKKQKSKKAEDKMVTKQDITSLMEGEFEWNA